MLVTEAYGLMPVFIHSHSLWRFLVDLAKSFFPEKLDKKPP